MEHAATELRASRVVLVPTYYAPDRDAGRIAGDSPKTATIDSLRSAIEDAARHGLRVALKPHIDREDGGFRGELAPVGGDRTRFFDAYRRLVIGPLGRLASAYAGTVDAFVVGTELSGVADAGEEWRATVASLRAVAPHVAVGFAANYDALVPGDRRPDVTAWADALDFLGVDYFPGESDEDYGFDRLARGLGTARRRTGLPLLFTELGSRADGPEGAEGQRRRIVAAIDRFGAEVAGFWMYNRFAVRDETDVERYTLAPPAVQELARRF
jgi:sugar phosphate isomerase/epimerase